MDKSLLKLAFNVMQKKEDDAEEIQKTKIQEKQRQDEENRKAAEHLQKVKDIYIQSPPL